ncbi:MAG: prepilin-type N-terminal cleavage/methylation domain-containing protein [Nitrospira sp. CR2.1]|nr:prepilin-type N-terminal cleavage/methylation domain-containing protein [Nitrospira sp. CR2.1]
MGWSTTMRRVTGNQQGFTLVELMAAVLITVVIVAAMMTTVVTSNRANVVNSQVADTQQNVRLAIDLLSRDIKLAGYNYNATDPSSAAVGACNATIGAVTKPVGLLPQDQSPNAADTGPDGISMVLPVNTAAWTLTAAAGGTANAVALEDSITLSGTAITEMVAQGMAVNSTVSIGGALSKTVKTIGATTIGFGTGNYVSGQFPIGTPVYLMQCVRYQIITNTPATCGSDAPCLVRDNVALVDGVEDMQITYACDGCNQAAPNPLYPDGVIDDQDGSSSGGFPTFSQGDFVSNGSWAIAPRMPDKIRMAQVSLVVRPTKADDGLDEKGTKAFNTTGPVIVGDHNPSSDAGYDAQTYQQQRRRVLIRTIQPRNL